jgi:polyisoprenoid-binding protein YceI
MAHMPKRFGRPPLGAAVVALLACTDAAPAPPAAEVSEAAPARGAAALSGPRGGEERLAITPSNTRIEWIAAKLHVKEEGSFTRFAGEVRLDPARLERSEVEVTIETASLWADPDRLADHLRDSDFLDAEQFPEAHFRSVSITASERDGSTHRVTGDLTLHGHTRRITFPAHITLGERLEVRAEFSIDRIDFDIAPKRADHLIRYLVGIRLTLDLPRAGG